MKLKIAPFLLLVTGLFPSLGFSNTIFFPQVAYGGGYSTTFVIINTGSTNVSTRLNFYTQGGTLRPDLGTQVDIAVGNSIRYTVPNNGDAVTVVWGELAAGSWKVCRIAMVPMELKAATVFFCP